MDLAAPPDAATAAALRAALDRHRLVCFRGQPLAEEHQLALVAALGPVALEGLDTPRPVGYVSNHRSGGALGSRAATFHSDYAFTDHPYDLISLYGLEIPASGTETRFVDAVDAAATLPPALRRRVEHLTSRAAVDVTSPVQEEGVRVRVGRLDETYPHALRPVLWPHPRTGEPLLAVWEQQTDALLPLPAGESAALLEELFAHLYAPERVYTHRWREHDLVLWDNCAVQHARPDVGTREPRTLRRVCAGVTPDLSIFVRRRAS